MTERSIDWDTVPDRYRSDIEEYCRENRQELPDNPAAALRCYMDWNGIIGYDRLIRSAFFELITSSYPYLANTDAERERWLRDLFQLDR